ncbi:hypothetical protein V6N11_020046 [Hibiscus sabdariffa]|uniref:Uncharacterized protein n=1 Tax=Hibiscus sabdariffa TaxID=183260 RepID=A0ABR2P8G4_9ROSI
MVGCGEGHHSTDGVRSIPLREESQREQDVSTSGGLRASFGETYEEVVEKIGDNYILEELDELVFTGENLATPTRGRLYPMLSGGTFGMEEKDVEIAPLGSFMVGALETPSVDSSKGHSIVSSVQSGDSKPFHLVRNDLSISYLFFADNLMVYAKADVHQEENIKVILEEFNLYSGHMGSC